MQEDESKPIANKSRSCHHSAPGKGRLIDHMELNSPADVMKIYENLPENAIKRHENHRNSIENHGFMAFRLPQHHRLLTTLKGGRLLASARMNAAT